MPHTHRSVLRGSFSLLVWQLAGVSVLISAGAASAAENAAAGKFHREIEPLLSKYCYDCHGNGVNKGRVSFDEFASDADVLAKRDLWLAALRNVRAGLMPPREEDLERPTAAEIDTLAHWIKYEAFGIDPQNPDPGRVTVRRLNRVEYRNTIRDLMGIDFNSEAEFPADDSGNGFDNNGDVLTISPLHLEKYLAAAETIIDRAVPKVAAVMRQQIATGKEFRAEGGGPTGDQLNAKRAAVVSRTFTVDHDEKYELAIELEVRGSFDFDPGRCTVICRVDGEERFVEDVVWSERRTIPHAFEVDWRAGEHVVSFEVIPQPPVEMAAANETASAAVALVAATETGSRPAAESSAPGQGAPKRERRVFRPPPTNLSVRIASVQVRGPLDRRFWIAPENHARFFPKGAAPEAPQARDAYATEVLRAFVLRAFRRPADDAKVAQLAAIAREIYTQPGRTFEEGIARAMMAVLASPRFLFRIEQPEAARAGERFAPVDEFSLASRLSYFLWSTMPDDELFELARRGELRRELRAQVTRMLNDLKAQAFIRNFTGQWLQARDIESVPINARVIFGPDGPAVMRTREGRFDFDGAFRKLMRSETEAYFAHVIREDRSVLELIDSDYTFLNEKLAALYGVPGVTGDELRLVKLPPDSMRGGVLTQGTVLTVTSNPTRTSPVKRGLFILENILGTPPPPPPPDVPDLEESKNEFGDREPKLSELLAAHRDKPMCASCHERMDPLGLAFENFNALGHWRDTEAHQPIEPAGQLITGERFADVRELKRVLARDRAMDVYRCLTEKLLTYALGRGLEYHDVHTVDEIVARLAREDGRVSVLIDAVVQSPAFQKQRTGLPASGSLSFIPTDAASKPAPHP